MEKQNIDTPSVDERIYTLVRPISFDGSEVKQLTIDFDELTGQDLIACANQAAIINPTENMSAPVRAFSLSYQIAVAAKAAKVTPELIRALKAKDFTQVTQKASNFLVGQG